MARLIVSAAAAAVVGIVSENPIYAAQTFAFVYGSTGFLDPAQKVMGPRLTDLTAPKADFGQPIAYIEGVWRTAGNVIWSSDKYEVDSTSSSDGKGGPQVDTTTAIYKIDLLIKLACNRCKGVRRIFSNGKLIWSNADDATNATITASLATSAFDDFRFYNGAPDQLPDPDYEAAVGVGNAPAYRTSTTVFLKGVNLGNNGQLPVLTFELLSEGDDTFLASQLAAVNGDYGFCFGTPAYSLAAPFDVMIYGSDIDTFNGHVSSFDVYTMDPATGVATHTGNWPIGLHNYVTMLGNSDESCFVIPEAPGFLLPITFYDYYVADGSSVRLDTSYLGTSSFTFSKRNDDIVVVCKDAGGTNDRKVRRYSRSNGALLVTGAAGTSDYCQAIAIGGAYAYGLASAGDKVFQWDLATLSLVATLAIPSAFVASAGNIGCDGDVPLVIGQGTVANSPALIKWNGATWDLIAYGADSSGAPQTLPPTPTLSLVRADPSGNNRFGVVDGIVFEQQVYNGGIGPNQLRINYLAARLAISGIPLDQLVSRLMLRTKLITAPEFDVTALAGQTVRGLCVSQVTPTRGVLESLMKGKLFSMFESGTQIVANPRGGASLGTIPFADLGISADGSAEPFPRATKNDVEFPKQVGVRYSNALNDYQSDVQFGDRLVTQSTSTDVTELPMVFTPSEAKKVADVASTDLQTSLTNVGPLALGSKYLKMQPTDIWTFTDKEGNQFRGRIDSVDVANFLPTINVVLDDATAVNSNVATDSDYESSTLVKQVSATELVVGDWPIFRDTDDYLGPTVAVAAKPLWPGAEVDKSIDDVTYVKAVSVGERTVIGAASTILGTFAGGATFDEINSVLVDVGDDTLSSYTKDVVVAGGADSYMLGTECICPANAVLQSASPNVYKLTSFLRGLRGTEQNVGAHAANETLARIQMRGLRKLRDDTGELNATRYYKAVTIGKSASAVDGSAFIDTGVAMKPFAVADLSVDRSDSAQLVVNWNRRSRYQSLLFGGSPPVGETSESYAVELYDASAVLQDSQTVPTPSYAVSGLTGGAYIIPPIWGMKTIGGDIIAVRDDIPYTTRSIKTLVKLASDGTVAQSSPNFGELMSQWVNNGDDIYLAYSNISNPAPNFYTSGKIVKMTRATLDTIDATNTAATPGDYQGLAFDGTNLWTSEYYSGNLRKLNPTTLVSVAAYAITGSPAALAYNAGKLWVCCALSHDLVKWDIATQTEDIRIAMGETPYDILIAGSLVYVACGATLQVFNLAGTRLFSYNYIAQEGQAQRVLSLFGSYVVASVYLPGFVGGVKIVFFTATTGVIANVVSTPIPLLQYVAGSSGSDLYITGRAGSGYSLQTRKYTVSPPGLVGYTVKVWQLSSVVGRGYPASLVL